VIAAAFHPKGVITRLSDFKSSEYAGLLGGADGFSIGSNDLTQRVSLNPDAVARGFETIAAADRELAGGDGGPRRAETHDVPGRAR
jgi:hypothetical protein